MKGIFSCFAESAKEFTKLRSLVITALFIAISMIIEAFSIDLQFAKLNFAFLAIAVIGMLFGPCMGLVAGFACDIVGYLVHPTGGFLPAYILVAGLQGLIYGLCLYHKMNGHSIQFRNNTTGKEWDITLFLRAVVARLLDVIVIADNCTDNTAEVARNAGAIVYERFNKVQVGKGYALDYLFNRIFEEKGDHAYDAFFVFDADNIVDPQFVREMNKMYDTGEYSALTSYRNSQNFCANWISAGYALWFLREAQYLNNARMRLGSSCAVSGTGFLFSDTVLRECGGWNFFLLTEDIEFTIDNVVRGHKVGYAAGAVLYDEQPTSFAQSWRQRMRWSKGYLQVFCKYAVQLFSGIAHGSFSCYDMTMNIMPAAVLTGVSLAVNVGAAITNVTNGGSMAALGISVLQTVASLYMTLFVLGMITTVTEWRKIRCAAWKKVLYTFTFPVFMLTYVPICIVSLFARVEWKPILHDKVMTLEQIESSGLRAS